MKNQTVPPRSFQSGLAWLTAVLFAILSAAAGVSLWTAQEKQRSIDTLAELQGIEIDMLSTALETESLISAQSLRRLQQVAGGQTVSALAQIHLPEGSALPGQITGFWSDEFATGFLRLPSVPTADQIAHLRVLVQSMDESAPFEITAIVGRSPQIISLSQPGNRPPPDQLILELSSHESSDSAERYTARWER